jgi:hypothetical protein
VYIGSQILKRLRLGDITAFILVRSCKGRKPSLYSSKASGGRSWKNDLNSTFYFLNIPEENKDKYFCELAERSRGDLSLCPVPN